MSCTCEQVKRFDTMYTCRSVVYHPQGDRQQQCVPSRAQKQPQSTWWAETAVGSNLTHHVALLVPPSGPMHPVVDRRGLAGWEKDRL